MKTTKNAPTALKRNENGYGALPAYADFALPEEDLAPGAVINGSEIAIVKLIDDTNTMAMGVGAAWLSGHNDVSAWQPAAPAGDNWKLAAVLDHEEGPYAVFARPGVHGVSDGKAAAQEFLLGELIKAATKHMKTLSKPWISMKEAEQQRVLATVAQDCRAATQNAIDLIAGNARMTFQAAVNKVVFKDGVKVELDLAKGPEAHILADAEGSYVTVVVEERSKLLDEGDALQADPDQPALFDKAA